MSGDGAKQGMLAMQVSEGQWLAVYAMVAEQGFAKRPVAQSADAVPTAAQAGVGQHAVGEHYWAVITHQQDFAYVNTRARCHAQQRIFIRIGAGETGGQRHHAKRFAPRFQALGQRAVVAEPGAQRQGMGMRVSKPA